MGIHPTAVISKGVIMGKNVSIGPYAVIEGDVTIGDNVEIGPAVYVTGKTKISDKVQIGKGSVIGTPPQDRSYKGEDSLVYIGKETIIREYVTIHKATGEGNVTEVGNNCYIMAYAHIAHNCKLHDNVTIANYSALSGYVEVGERAFLSGYVGVHQFVKIGKIAMIEGYSKITKDVLPYSLIAGNPPKLFSINVVGLRRAGYSKEQIFRIEEVFKLFYNKKNTLTFIKELLKEKYMDYEELISILDFSEDSARGILR